MTARQNPASDRMAGAAARRPDPGPRAGPDGDPDHAGAGDRRLGPATSTGLNRWVGTAAAVAASPDVPRLPLAKAIRAMIHATTVSEAVTSAVIEQLRQGQD